MRRALRSGDIQGVAAFVLPKRRTDQTQNSQSHYRIPLADYGMRVGTGDSVPSIRITGDTATVVPHGVYHFGLLPGGDALEMTKEDGEWYFTGRLFVD
jgi:hypothetical protein